MTRCFRSPTDLVRLTAVTQRCYSGCHVSSGPRAELGAIPPKLYLLILLYNEPLPCPVVSFALPRQKPRRTHIPPPTEFLMSRPFSPSRSQPTLSRSVLSTISRLFATPMADQLTESQSMPDVPLTEFPPSRRRGGSISESKPVTYSVSQLVLPTSRPAVLDNVVEM